MFLPLYDSNKIAHIEFPYVNYAILGLTTLIFMVHYASGPDGLFHAHLSFGMIPIVVWDTVPAPVPWLPDQATLLTYMFLHADWLHLLTNMLFLWVFGDNIEDALGHVRYLVFYLACGVLAGVLHLLIFAGDNGPLVGASGAVAGVIGAYIVLYPHVRVFVLSRIVIPLPLALPAWSVLGLWIASQLFFVLVGSEGDVAWWAHIGGVLAGLVLVFVFKRRETPLFGGR